MTVRDSRARKLRLQSHRSAHNPRATRTSAPMIPSAARASATPGSASVSNKRSRSFVLSSAASLRARDKRQPGRRRGAPDRRDIRHEFRPPLREQRIADAVDRRDIGLALRNGGEARRVGSGDDHIGEERPPGRKRRHGRAKQVHARIAVARIDRRARAAKFAECPPSVVAARYEKAAMVRALAAVEGEDRRRDNIDRVTQRFAIGIAAGLAEDQPGVAPMASGGLSRVSVVGAGRPPPRAVPRSRPRRASSADAVQGKSYIGRHGDQAPHAVAIWTDARAWSCGRNR